MEDLEKWFQERNAWVRSAVNKVQEKEDLGEDDYKELADLCIKEAKDDLDVDDLEEIEISTSRVSSDKIKLKSLKNVEGINALAPKNPLKFSNKKLSIVYGQNGSGKSGYVRILKHICGARHPGKLLPNVFKDSPTEQKCDVDYEVNGNNKTINWKRDDGKIDELGTVDIYDTSSSKFYVDNENEVTYEPPLLEIFSDLVKVAERLSKKIKGLIKQKVSKKPSLPSELEETEFGKKYLELTAEIDEESIKELTDFTGEEQVRLKELKERLNTESPAKKAKKLAEKKSRLNSLILTTIHHVRQLSDKNCTKIFDLDSQASIKEESAETAANKIFSSSPLDGVGTSVWEQLWDKAREYSESHAYKGKTFPVTNEESRCVLCHQLLSDDAKERLQSFEDYVKGELKKDAIKKRELYKKAVDSLLPVESKENISTALEAIGIDNEETVEQIKQLYFVLNQRFEKVKEVKDLDELTPIPNSWDLLKEARNISQSYHTTAKKYQKDAKGDNRESLEIELKELEAKEWLSNQSEAIIEEVSRLKEVKTLSEAKKLTNTSALSRKKGALAEELITDAFVGRFNDELKKLGASWINIELVKSQVEKGRVLHKLQLENAEQQVPDEILSEGENRIVTLAAFLADVTGKNVPAPFVFDDPITSLDEDFEEAVVQRLIELSLDRQVIVFTHRLSLTSLLEELAKEADLNANFVSVRRESWGTGNPGDTPINVKRPDKALNTLLNNRLSPARKAYEKEGREVYDPLAKSICSDFRILLERMVEDVLLSDVVHRFRRSVQTKGKIQNLSKITDLDSKYFDDMMSKYSKFEHSQPRSTPVQMPTPDELETDLGSLKEWYDEFTNR
ncbi:MAG TPA: hypothetical protein VJ964_02160 [Balneolaceae bacterium]|nr:hypothetical protein [Balneolaceae bacterium]